MTYSIIARDRTTGQMGIATQSQAFAVGASVPWAVAGYGVVATQSMGEPMYGELGLSSLQSGLTASEALTALRSVDPHPERRQVGMIDSYGNIDAYTGSKCVAEAGHCVGESYASLANMMSSNKVWDVMVEACATSEGPLATRLLAALHAAEDIGGDFRGQRSASVMVVRAERTGRPWRDQIVDLRVDNHPHAVDELDRLVAANLHYHLTVEAFELAMNGDAEGCLSALDNVPVPDPQTDPDRTLWSAIILALSDEHQVAAERLRELADHAPEFLEAAYRFIEVELIPPDLLTEILPPRPQGFGRG